MTMMLLACDDSSWVVRLNATIALSSFLGCDQEDVRIERGSTYYDAACARGRERILLDILFENLADESFTGKGNPFPLSISLSIYLSILYP